MNQTTQIHPMSVVDASAKLGVGVVIGPFCTVGPHVELGDGSELVSQVSISGRTKIGAGARIFPFASIGHIPQDLKYHGEESTLEIGTKCMIREGVTMNPGTEGGGLVTRVGDRCTFLANSHVAHDCIVGNDVIFSNNVMLAGHCQVGDFAILGGGAAVHQFCRIGAHAFTSINAMIWADLPPFVMCQGQPAQARSMNFEGLRRRGFSAERIKAIKEMHKLLYRDGLTLEQSKQGIKALDKEYKESAPDVLMMLDFLNAPSAERGIVR